MSKIAGLGNVKVANPYQGRGRPIKRGKKQEVRN